jgi:hypothetical protein
MAIHGDTTSGHIVRYVQTSDPGAVGAGVVWVDLTTNLMKVRNTGDTAWITLNASPTQLISSQTLGSDSASITFSSIPGTFDSLRLVMVGRTGEASFLAGVLAQFNADTGSNYTSQAMFGIAGTANAAELVAQTHATMGWLASSAAGTHFAGSFVADIPGYAGTTWYKSGNSRSSDIEAATTGKNSAVLESFGWLSQSAITGIVLTVATGANFITGTVAKLYGVNG